MSEHPAKQAKLLSYFIQQNPSVQTEPGTSSTSATSEIHPDLTHPDFVIGSELDIGAYDSKEKPSDQQKYNFLTNTWKPKSLYKFPRVERKVKGKVRYVSFQRKWLDDYKWLAYSPSQNGGFCKSCRIFAPERVSGVQLQVLVKKPMNNYKDATSILAAHATKEYHQLAHTKAENFIQIQRSSRGNVVEQMSQNRANRAHENRKGMLSLINIVKLCGRQMLSFRGHRDFGKIDQPEDFETNENEGNFRALVRFRIQSGDEDLRRFILSSGINAQYTSWSTQNEIVQLCGGFVRKALVQRISESGYFSVLADETSDVSNCEQFSICVRYVHKPFEGKYELREDFLGFVEAKSLTGEYLANLLLKTLAEWGLELNQLRGQGYDGAANMSGSFRGVQAWIKEQYPKALFTHCRSHCLNLVIGQACQVFSIQKSLRVMKEAIVFISNSPKRMACLTNAITALTPQSRHTRLKSLCETRWVQRHEAVAVFHELYSPVLHALNEIERTSDSVSSDKAEALQMRMRTIEFVSNINILAHTLALTHSLSVALQSKTIDLKECADMIKNVKICLESRLANAEREFEKIFKDIETTLEKEEISTTTRGLRSSATEDVKTAMLLRN
ncbi:52 kDa repressor of the inhibitor of the protein kinase-like [Styela clava]